MRDVMPWVQQNLGLPPWVTVVALMIGATRLLMPVIGEFLALVTAIWSSSPARRESALQVLEYQARSHSVRLRRRTRKKP